MRALDLHCIVYVSAARWLFTPDELEGLLVAARTNNAAAEITGCLLYSGGSIMQVLEGPADAVQATYARICRSPMHAGIIKILDVPVAAREFPAWSMAFDRTTAEEFFRLREVFEADASPPSRAFEVLKGFWRHHR